VQRLAFAWILITPQLIFVKLTVWSPLGTPV
jgi:hypothetical protein